MGHRAWGIGHGASGIGHRASGIGHTSPRLRTAIVKNAKAPKKYIFLSFHDFSGYAIDRCRSSYGA